MPASSCLSFPKPAIMGLSCMLFPFWPLNPHRFVRLASCAPSPPMLPAGLLLLPLTDGLGGPRVMVLGLPPRMADTDECGDRACFWIAEVMEMHSEITSETGSTATETGLLRYCIRGAILRGSNVPEDRGISILLERCASRLMIWCAEVQVLELAEAVSRFARWMCLISGGEINVWGTNLAAESFKRPTRNVLTEDEYGVLLTGDNRKSAGRSRHCVEAICSWSSGLGFLKVSSKLCHDWTDSMSLGRSRTTAACVSTSGAAGSTSKNLERTTAEVRYMECHTSQPSFFTSSAFC